MNKRGLSALVLGVLFILMLSNLCSAADANQTKLDGAYKCLKDKVTANKDVLSLQEAIFSVLALGDFSGNTAKIESEKKSGESCWPKDSCKIKETAQVLIAYDRIGRGKEEIKNWLNSKNSTTTELNWFLEIDIPSRVQSTCKLKYDSKEYSITISEKGEVSGSTGNCLSIPSPGYMLKINNNCLGKSFEISCKQQFVTSTVYQKNRGGTFFIPSNANSAAEDGTTTERANSLCFKSGTGSCDYEGGLWAALALKTAKQDVSAYLPYLLAFADDNTRYFPSTFLYTLTAGDDYSAQIAQLQKQGKFWEIIGSPYNKFYDTSLAMMALESKTDLDVVKDYLLSIQGTDGCWNSGNIRDTSFVLYSGWKRGVSGGGGGGTIPTCDSPKSCEIESDCLNSSGTVQTSFYCSAGKVCCSVKVQGQTCTQKNGIICSAEEDCKDPGIEEIASDGICCVGGACITKQQPADRCTPAGGTCKTTCDSSETIGAESCLNADEICCKKPSSNLWIWIVLLIILIGLAAAGIIYRDKVRIWYVMIKDRLKKKPSVQTQAGARPAAAPQRPLIPARVVPQMFRAPARLMARPVAKDKELEETLKRLKELNK